MEEYIESKALLFVPSNICSYMLIAFKNIHFSVILILNILACSKFTQKKNNRIFNKHREYPFLREFSEHFHEQLGLECAQELDMKSFT